MSAQVRIQSHALLICITCFYLGERFGMVSRAEAWVCNLIAGLDEYADREILVKVLEQCGRKCQSPAFIRKARSIYEKSDSIQEFLEKLSKVYKHLHRNGDNVHIVYPKCYCSIVNKIPLGKLPATYCNCSRGWAKALFEGALGKPVEVVMEKSIISGDNECRFKIVL